MNKFINFLVSPSAVIAMSLIVLAGCSDDETEPIELASLETLDVADITQTTAQSGGNITDDGGGEITSRGVVWSTEANPTLEDHSGITVDGKGPDMFQSNLTDLSPATTYYVRAYATNSAGISFGNDVMFETMKEDYLLTLGINPEEAGDVTGAGEYQVGEQIDITATANEGWEFVNWTGDTEYLDDSDSETAIVTMPEDNVALTANFELVDYTLTLVANPAEGGTVSGGGKYNFGDEVQIEAVANFYWEFVNWSGDTDFIDNPISVSTTATMPAQNISLMANFQETGDPEPGAVTDIDGNVYQTVIIGNQEWMAENLRVSRYNNGDNIPTGLSDDDWVNTTEGAYAIYNNDEDMLEAYGKLYNWYSVDDSRGLCPDGWHVPDDGEWMQLVDYTVSQGFPFDSESPDGVGNALKSCHQVNSPEGGECDTSVHPRWNSDEIHHGFDEFGFSALPGGVRWDDGYLHLGNLGFWWASTEYSFSQARYWRMSLDSGSVHRFTINKRNGFSLRCVRNIE